MTFTFCCQGTEEVEGISLNMDNLKDVLSISSCQVFNTMPHLRFLLFTSGRGSNKVHLPNGLHSLPDDLIILEWYKYPLKTLPSNFSPEKLVELNLSFSNIKQLWEGTKGLKEQPTKFGIFLPGTEIPEWFTYQSVGSSVNIPVLRQDLVNRKLMGFAICAVLGFEEYQNINLEYLRVKVDCRFEAYYHFEHFPLSYKSNDFSLFIDSDHILLGYSSFSNKFDSLSQNLEKLFASANDSVDISFEIKDYYGVKHYAVHPIYAEPNEIIVATIEDIGETSGLRSGRSDDNEEKIEPHP
ncbi:hypothetical protein Ddye_027580 [Dipteronia dyeriana]|uniref:C-JID domain-containing protein n=1 Tax=Dipteronia dyeriana TaxID=168575 RepID=A0AAD9TPE0_9ROSI|nr:hypothetical protein Ddye_027580 [Dipteronia dyeriana]